MWRRRIVVPLAFVLAGLGWAAAHSLAHRLAMTQADETTATGLQGYLGYVPTSVVLCLALALPLAAWATAGGDRRRSASLRSLWLFGLVPVLGFAGHALVEPLLAGPGSLAASGTRAAALAPVLLVGLLVQLPFALAALGLARGLLVLVERVAGALDEPRPRADRRERGRLSPPQARHAPAFRLDRACPQRAPPFPLPT